MDAQLKDVVALRKMLVREFTDVDDAKVLQVLTASLPAMKAFTPKVNDYLTNELGPVSAFLPEDEK